MKIIRFPFPSDRSVTLYLIISTSLAIVPICMAWSSQLHIYWQERTVQIFFYLSFALLIIMAMRNMRRGFSRFHFTDFTLFLVFFLALAIRFLMSRNLVAPAWVDSVHHALITQLILQNGAFPNSYEPYLSISTSFYHSGFHANTALFTWLSTLSLPTSMLVFGQILNALAAYSAYVFTLSFYPNRLAGLFAAIAVAFLSPMPAYYTSWGRYTQLCGLLILPALIYLYQRRLPIRFSLARSAILSTLLLISILFAGLIIIHYRVSFFFALLLGLCVLIRLFRPSPRPVKKRWILTFGYLTILGLLTLLLSASWLPQAWTSLLLPKLNAWRQPPASPETIPWKLLTPAMGKLVLALALWGFLIDLWHRSRQGLTLALWIALCFSTVYLSYYGLKGIGFVNMTSVTISLYLPLSALGGQGTFQFLQWLRNTVKTKTPAFLNALSLGIILLCAIFGGKSLLPLLNPITLLVRNADLQAMSFIRSTVAADQKLLIQPFLWGYGIYAGNDGGSWIPALAQRATLPPPVLFALDDSGDQIRQINQVSQSVLEKAKDPEAIAGLMYENNLQYLYLGARGGPIAPSILTKSQHFELIYHQGSVFLFKLRPLQSPP